MSTANPTEHEVLLEAIRSQVARVHTSLPGVVVSYDEATQTASVRPAFKFAYKDPNDGSVKRYTPPAIPNVPVAFPGAGDFSITWPLAAGDQVLLVFSERSLDEWRTVAGSGHEPGDLRRFDLSDAVAYPGLRSPAAPIPIDGYAAGVTVVRATEVRLGSSLATAKVMLVTFEADLLTWLAALLAMLSALATLNPVTIAAAAITYGTAHTAFVASVTAGHGATKVKAE